MKDEYQVLSLVLRERYRESVAQGIVCTAFFDTHSFLSPRLWGDTEGPEEFGKSSFGLSFPEMEWETWSDVHNKSKEKVLIEPRFEGVLCELLLPKVTTKDGKHTTSDEFWSDFHIQYPHAPGIFHMSRVGLNSERSQALLCISILSTGFKREGYYFFLTYSSEWAIRGQLLAWMS